MCIWCEFKFTPLKKNRKKKEQLYFDTVLHFFFFSCREFKQKCKDNKLSSSNKILYLEIKTRGTENNTDLLNRRSPVALVIDGNTMWSKGPMN